jgi:D-serine deaminase-like pyridoxal phosphate-dependent protein
VSRLLDHLPTPVAYVDVARMDANIRAMAEATRVRGVGLRPHAKTHKIPEIARLQVQAGATGVAAATLAEAEAFADSEVEDIFIAHEVLDPTKIDRLLDLAGRIRLRCGVDSAEGHARSPAQPGAGARCWTSCSRWTRASAAPASRAAR